MTIPHVILIETKTNETNEKQTQVFVRPKLKRQKASRCLVEQMKSSPPSPMRLQQKQQQQKQQQQQVQQCERNNTSLEDQTRAPSEVLLVREGVDNKNDSSSSSSSSSTNNKAPPSSTTTQSRRCRMREETKQKATMSNQSLSTMSSLTVVLHSKHSSCVTRTEEEEEEEEEEESWKYNMLSFMKERFAVDPSLKHGLSKPRRRNSIDCTTTNIVMAAGNGTINYNTSSRSSTRNQITIAVALRSKKDGLFMPQRKLSENSLMLRSTAARKA